MAKISKTIKTFEKGEYLNERLTNIVETYLDYEKHTNGGVFSVVFIIGVAVLLASIILIPLRGERGTKKHKRSNLILNVILSVGVVLTLVASVYVNNHYNNKAESIESQIREYLLQNSQSTITPLSELDITHCDDFNHCIKLSKNELEVKIDSVDIMGLKDEDLIEIKIPKVTKSDKVLLETNSLGHFISTTYKITPQTKRN